MPLDHLRAVVVVAVALVAVVCDVRTRRVPNILTFGSAGAALVVSGVVGGLPALGSAAAGWLVGAVLFMPFFVLGGMGAGDVKLVAALGAWLGPLQALWLAAWAAVAGGAMALVVAAATGYLGTALRNVWFMATYWRVHGVRPVPGLTLGDAAAPRMAYAIPVAIGAVCTVWRL